MKMKFSKYSCSISLEHVFAFCMVHNYRQYTNIIRRHQSFNFLGAVPLITELATLTNYSSDTLYIFSQGLIKLI